MEVKEELDIGQEYEIKGYPKDFSERVIGRYLGEAEGELYFAFNRGDKKTYVSLRAHFAEVDGTVVSTKPISSFGTFLFSLDELNNLKDENSKSRLIKILRNFGEDL